MLITQTSDCRTRPSCTLGIGTTTWNHDTDGLVSISVDQVRCTLDAVVLGSRRARRWQQFHPMAMIATRISQTLISVPCFDMTPGELLTTTANKTIAAYSFNGDLVVSADIVNDYYGIFGTPGIRQAVTIDGSSYWMSGGGAQGRGFQYLASLNAGVTSYVSGAVSAEPGFEDARGVTIFNGQLYGSDSLLDSADPDIYTGVYVQPSYASICALFTTHYARSVTRPHLVIIRSTQASLRSARGSRRSRIRLRAAPCQSCCLASGLTTRSGRSCSRTPATSGRPTRMRPPYTMRPQATTTHQRALAPLSTTATRAVCGSWTCCTRRASTHQTRCTRCRVALKVPISPTPAGTSCTPRPSPASSATT